MNERTHDNQPNHLNPQTLHHLAGNWSDDDGLAIDEYFEAADHGPQEHVYVEGAKAALPVTNRLITRAIPFTFDTSGGAGEVWPCISDPVLALPADPNRTLLMIAYAVGHTEPPFIPVFIASEKSGCYGEPTHYLVVYSGGLMTIPGYTGPVWIMAASIDGVVESPPTKIITVTAVTS